VLLVVVDQPRIRRRGDDPVETGAEVELPRVAVQHARRAPARPHARELSNPLQRVERVPAQEASSLAHRPARPLVLVAPVLRALRGAREVEIEVRRAPRGPGRARQDDSQDIRVLVVVDKPAEEEQLGGGPRRVPVANVFRDLAVRTPTVELLEPRARVTQLRLEHERVVLGRLHAHEEAVEGGDVRAARGEPRLERLHQCRPRPCERIEDAAARHVTLEQRLDELRDELAQVRMEPVDVLRSLPLGELPLRPRKVEVDAPVERVLRRGHGPERVLRPA
jgi:hypothetical protein